METNNKTIAKNTLFLYFRMMFTMVVGLFTSRVILQKLGVDDYGIYQAVGGIVGFLSFINGALSTGSSRFLTYALGEGNADKLKRTFSTTLIIHILLALFIALLSETVGLWFLNNKLIIASERMDAAIYTFHLSIVATVLSITQVPYNASLISHERMSIYAYMSIYDVSAKLLVCYLLSIGNIDRLILYSSLILAVQVSSLVFYRLYCIRHFEETLFAFSFDKNLFKDIAKFSGWSLFANSAIALNSQGILVLLNMFFSPSIVAARAISLQVNMAANQFVNNFRQAVNPQIVKKYAAGEFYASKQLLLESTKYSYYMMFLLSLPICILAQPLLKLWLGVVPEYTVPFLQIVILQNLFQVFDTSFYMALYAKGQLKQNALLSPTMLFLSFISSYCFFKLGFSPLSLSWATFVAYAVLGLIIKPILITHIVDYTWKDIWSVFRPCLLVTSVSIPIPLLTANYIGEINFISFITIVIVCTVSIVVTTYFLGIDRETRNRLMAIIRSRVQNKG